MRLGPGLLYEGRTLQGARPKLADFCSATMAEFYSAVDTSTLWGTMTERFPPLRALLSAEAPNVATLVEQARSQGALSAQAEESRERFGNVWCGGEIEKSLREVVQG